MMNLARRMASTMIAAMPGDGIGPEVFRSVAEIFDAAQVPVT